MTNQELVYENLNADAESFLSSLCKYPSQKRYINFNGCILREHFKNYANEILELEIRNDDIWVCSYQKSGTTWTQEMIWCIYNDLDFEAAQEIPMFKRFPFLERSSLYDFSKEQLNYAYLKQSSLNSVEYVKNLPSPRLVKSHLPFHLLPKQLQNNSTSAKVIHVSRNPKDNCVSFYHHSRLLDAYDGSFRQFAESYLKGNVPYGSYFDHLKGFRTQKNNPNFLFLTYEEMKTNLKAVIYKVANFLKKNLNQDDVKKLLDHLSFSSMKQNKAVNFAETIEVHKNLFNINESGSFMRKGEVGGWREIMDSDICERFEKLEKIERENYE